MTKIKNTKKGMAKKTLSMSLVVAMLATSNVPVWAAEFSDGTDASGDDGFFELTHSCDCEGEGFDKVNEVLAFFSGDVVDFLVCRDSPQLQHYRGQR